MINLLASLVDRALDRAPILQRRQPSLFEPVNDAAISTTHDDVGDSLREEEMVADSATSATARPTVEIRSALFSNSPENLPAPQRPLSAETSAPNRIDVIDNAAKAKAEPGLLDADPTVRVEQHEHSTIRQEPVARDLAEPARLHHAKTTPHEHSIDTIVETKLEHEVVFQNPIPERGPEKTTLLKQLPETSLRSIANNVIAQRTDTRKRTPQKIDGTALVKAPAQRRATRQETQRPIRPRLQSEPRYEISQGAPTINVTIGRVEVRAAAAIKRVDSARPARPKLSLEDYLRGRSEGK